MMINVTLKDGVVKQYEQGTTAAEVAKSLGAGLYKAACAAKVTAKPSTCARRWRATVRFRS